jgi:hypothetical protein
VIDHAGEPFPVAGDSGEGQAAAAGELIARAAAAAPWVTFMVFSVPAGCPLAEAVIAGARQAHWVTGV